MTDPYFLSSQSHIYQIFRPFLMHPRMYYPMTASNQVTLLTSSLYMDPYKLQRFHLLFQHNIRFHLFNTCPTSDTCLQYAPFIFRLPP